MRSSVRRLCRCSSVRSMGRSYGNDGSLMYVRPLRWMRRWLAWLSEWSVDVTVRCETAVLTLVEERDSVREAKEAGFTCFVVKLPDGLCASESGPMATCFGLRPVGAGLFLLMLG